MGNFGKYTKHQNCLSASQSDNQLSNCYKMKKFIYHAAHAAPPN